MCILKAELMNIYVCIIISLYVYHLNWQAQQIGVFSCGPPPMTLTVEKGCTAANKCEGFPSYSHHFENF